MAVRTWVGRFSIVDGHVQEESTWLGSLIRQRPDEEADELYILIEPPETGQEYTSQLVDVIAQLYSRDPLSLTGALTRSLKAAHEHLRDWNEKSLKEHRTGAGASCLALRGAEAYLAQTGPSVAYTLTETAFRRLAPEHPDFAHALGLADPFEPRITRVSLDPGDLLLVASSQIDKIAPPEHIRRILDRGADEALPELYLLCRDQPQFSLVLLSCFEEEEAISPPAFLTKDGDSAALEVLPSHEERTATATAVLDAPAAVTLSATPAQASLGAGAGADFTLPRRPAHEQVREIAQSTAPPPSTGVRLRGGDATPRYKRSAGGAITPQFRIPKLAVFGVLAAALLGLLIWWQLPGSVKQNREDRFTALVANARESNARAQASSDPALKRQLLNSAQSNLADAAKIHADNGDVATLKQDVTAGIATLDNVFEIKTFTQIADLSQQVTGSLSITRAVVGGDQAYFLDAKGKRVLSLPIDGSRAPETIFEDGAIEGVITASRPTQIAWSDQTSSLIILDDKREAFAYFPGRGTLPITVRGSETWSSVDAIAASSGNLYLLDVKGNQIWRYLAGPAGFDTERIALLENANLKDATEIGIGQNIYVLDAKSGLREFIGKTETAAPLAGLDMPLVSAASLSVLPGSSRLVFADRGNKRIILAAPDGAFIRQIVSSSFTDLRGVSVDEGKGILYVLNGDALLKAPFPP